MAMLEANDWRSWPEISPITQSSQRFHFSRFSVH